MMKITTHQVRDLILSALIPACTVYFEAAVGAPIPLPAVRLFAGMPARRSKAAPSVSEFAFPSSRLFNDQNKLLMLMVTSSLNL